MVVTKKLDDALISKICNYAKNVFMPCHKKLHDSTKICLSDQILNVYEPKIKATYAFMDYMCSKNAVDLNQLMVVSTDECIMSKKPQVEKALAGNLEFLINMDMTNIPVVLKLLEALKEKKCLDLIKLEGVLTSLFVECDNKRPVELLSEALRKIIETTPCRGMKG